MSDQQQEHLITETGVSEPHHDGHARPGLFQDTATFVLIPFLIVLLILWRAGAFKMLGTSLDTKSKLAHDELETAQKLREEAAELLASYQRRQREAEEEAENIITLAKNDAKRLAAEMRTAMEDKLDRRTKAAEAKIAMAEAQAIAEIRNNTADLASRAAEAIIRDGTDAQQQASLIDAAIDDVENRMN